MFELRKGKKSIVDGWKENGKWIRKVKEGLQRNGIEEYDFEELEIKDIKKKTERLVEEKVWFGIQGSWRERKKILSGIAA